MMEKSSGAVLFRRTPEVEYLLLHYPGGHWDFPKGHVEGEETEEENARREIQEETGITDITLIPNFREEMHYWFKRGNSLVSKTVAFFAAETNATEVVLSHEHQAFGWLPFDAALEKLTFQNAKDVLEKVDAALKNPPNPKIQKQQTTFRVE